MFPMSFAPHDVRMRGFRHRTEVVEVLRLIDARIHPLQPEYAPLQALAGRVLAASIVATMDVPPFDRAAMDGYALRGEETFGAGPYNPLSFSVVAESLPGNPTSVCVQSGQAVRIMTGAKMPDGADTVVPAEATTEVDGSVHVVEAVPPGRNISHRGEDIRHDSSVLQPGRQLRPQDVALLAALGYAEAAVIRQPRVVIIITGDELLPPGTQPTASKIVDSNSVMLAALVRRDGGLPQVAPIVPDREEAIRQTLIKCMQAADVLLVSGGSSVGREDHAPMVVARLGELLVHGVAMRPASPAGFGLMPGPQRSVPVFLLPGNPVSCLAAYDFFAGRAIRLLGGRRREWPYRTVREPLKSKIASAIGRVDYVRGRLSEDGFEPLAVSGASLLSTTTRADGFVVVEQDSEGTPPGTLVEVWLYDL
jgi:molybdopterin molybdotransferase